MMHITDYTDLVHPDATRREPSDEEIATVAASILAYLKGDANAWHETLAEAMAHGKPAAIGEALRDGDLLEAGRMGHEAVLAKFSEDASQLAEDWLNDCLTAWDKQRLGGWRPVRFASLGRRYHLAEIFG